MQRFFRAFRPFFPEDDLTESVKTTLMKKNCLSSLFDRPAGFVRFGETVSVFVLFSLLLILAHAVVQDNTLTYDEGRHFRYGGQMIGGNSSRFNESEMPVSAFHVLPGFLANYVRMNILKESRFFDEVGMIVLGRYVSAAFLVALGLLVYLWSRQLYGVRGALLSLILFVFSPTLLAHGTLTTPDIINAALVTLTFYLCWQYTHNPSGAAFVRASLAWGLAQASKYSSVHLIMISGIIEFFRQGPKIYWGTFRTGPYLKRLVLAALLVLGVINVAWYFKGTGTQVRHYEFRSSLFSNLQKSFAYLPVPVPYPYLEGVDWVRESEESGSAGGRHGNIYLMGRLSPLGFKGYFLVAHFLKNPIALHIILAWALVLHYRRQMRYSWHQDEVFLAVPVLYLFFTMSLFFNTQLGIRMILPVYPLLFIYCGKVGDGERGKTGSVLVVLLLSWYAVSSLSYHPNYLSYFNESIGKRRYAYRYLADSNLEWGQSGREIDRFLRDNPDVIRGHDIPSAPKAGRYLIDANNLVGVFDPARFAWLREHFEPVRHVGHTNLLFEVSEAEVEALIAERARYATL